MPQKEKVAKEGEEEDKEDGKELEMAMDRIDEDKDIVRRMA